MNFVVTGGNGYIGLHICYKLIFMSNVIIIDILCNSIIKKNKKIQEHVKK